MSEKRQKIFKRAYTEQLREDLASEISIDDYLKHRVDFPEEAVLQSTLVLNCETPDLKTDVNSDVENAIMLYEFLADLDMTQASDKRLWIYLSHVTFRNYTMGRWGLNLSARELRSSPEKRRKAINYIGDRWFLTGNARSLRRHSIARLWWAARLTVAPWEKHSEYFEELETTDRYVYTRVLFSTEDLVQQILERRLGWSDRTLIAILEYLRQNEEVARSRKSYRSLIKELNLVLGYRKLSVLSFDALLKVIADTAQAATISA